MAVTCPACRSDLTQSLAGLDQCLACSAHFDPVTGVIATETFGGSLLPVPNIPEPTSAESAPAPTEDAL